MCLSAVGAVAKGLEPGTIGSEACSRGGGRITLLGPAAAGVVAAVTVGSVNLIAIFSCLDPLGI